MVATSRDADMFIILYILFCRVFLHSKSVQTGEKMLCLNSCIMLAFICSLCFLVMTAVLGWMWACDTVVCVPASLDLKNLPGLRKRQNRLKLLKKNTRLRPLKSCLRTGLKTLSYKEKITNRFYKSLLNCKLCLWTYPSGPGRAFVQTFY